jgi:Bacterial membrane protein YfhO
VAPSRILSAGRRSAFRAVIVSARRTHATDRSAPAPRRRLGFTVREHAAALAIFAAVTVSFFYPVARGETFSEVPARQHQVYPWAAETRGAGAGVLHYDYADSFYPWQVFMSRALHDGQFPLWNPHGFGGAPFFANGQNGVLYPPRLALTYTVSATRVHDLLLATHFLFAGVAMFLLLGYVGLSFPSALVGGLAWMLNSFALVWQGLENYVGIEVWLPIAVLLADMIVRRRSWPATFGLALVLGLLFVGGNVLFVELAVTAVFAYAATLGLVAARRERSALLGHGSRLAVAAVLFVGVVAVALLPTLELSDESVRASPTYAELDEFALSWRSLANLVRPPELLDGDPYHDNLFAGTLVAALAIVGLTSRAVLARYAAGLAILTLLYMLHTPVTFVVNLVLPGLENLKPLGRAAFLLQFALAVLAAFGLEAVLRHLARPGGRRLAHSTLLRGALVGAAVGALVVRAAIGRIDFAVACVLALPAAVLGAIAVEALLARFAAATDLRAALRRPVVGALLGAAVAALIVHFWIVELTYRVAFPIALAAAGALALAVELAAPRELVVRSYRRLPAAIPAWAVTPSALLVIAIAGSIVGQALLEARSAMPHQPYRMAGLYPRTPAVRYLERPDDGRPLPTAGFLQGSTAMIYGLRSAGGYESLLPGRIESFWRVVGDGLSPSELASNKLIYAYYRDYSLSTLRPDRLARAGVSLVAAPPSDVDGGRVPRGLELRYDGRDGRVFAVAGARPRAYVVAGCEEVAEPLDSLERFTAPGFSPGGTVILEREFLRSAGLSCAGGSAGRAGSAAVVDESLNSVVVRVRAERPAWLVVTDSWHDGWSATVDGRDAPVVPANYAQRAVKITSGTHSVRFEYEPSSFRLGSVVSATALAVVLGGLALSLRKRSR